MLKVCKFGDPELKTSHPFVVWSKWSHLYPWDCTAMLRLIGEGLDGVGVAGYRADLIRRLDHVLSRLDRGWEFIDIGYHRPFYNAADIPGSKWWYG